jgi:branched-chain amino acid transport system substrate-binding protein
MRADFRIIARSQPGHVRNYRHLAARIPALAAACLSLAIVFCCPVHTAAANAKPSPPCSTHQPAAAHPIVVGDLSTLTGRFHFPESAQAATTVFDAVNAQCGIHGRRVAYEVLDDVASPAKAAELARVLIEDRDAVALVGGTSAVSCAVNAARIASVPIAAIPGIGTVPECFDSPNIAPPNTGVFAITTLALKFAALHLAPEKLCLVGNAHPNIPGNFRAPVEHFQRLTGRSAIIVNQELHIDDEPAPVVQDLLRAQCDVVFVGTLAQYAARLVNAVAREPSLHVKLVLAPEAYTASFAANVDPTMNGRVFATTDMDFLDSEKPGMKRIRPRLQSADVELSPFAVAGSLAAQILVDTLKSIKGPITHQTVLDALRRMSPYDTQGLTASPYVFAWTEERRSPAAIHVVVLREGTWAHAAEEWISLDPGRGRPQ